MREIKVGSVEHYYSHLGVAAVKLDGGLKVGDSIHILGHTSDFTQNIDSIQIDHKNVDHAESGDSVGIKITQHGREHDAVYKVVKD
jgi:putative protease